MKSRLFAFNTYLCVAALLVCVGCRTSEESKRKKELSTLRLFLEAHADGSHRVQAVPIVRNKPVLLTIYKSDFLDETSVAEAAVVDQPGGCAISIKFDHHGTLLLESTTVGQRGSRIAIYSEFPEPRWLAAVMITRPIADGLLTFVPDATRAEAERIVRGLNNVARKQKKKITW